MLNLFYDKFLLTNNLKFKDYNFFLEDLPFVMFPVEVLSVLLEKTTPEQEIAIYRAGKEAMLTHLIPRFKRGYGLTDDKFLHFVLEYLSFSGFGQLSIIHSEKESRKAIVIASNSPIAQALHGKCKRSADHYLRGILAGLFSSFFKGDVDCLETKCTALGHHTCEFVIQPLYGFDAENDQVKEQLPKLGEALVDASNVSSPTPAISP